MPRSTGRLAPPCAGSAIRDTARHPRPTSTACATNGHACPTANNAAPIGGPTSWLTVTKPACSRELRDRQVVTRATSIGSSVLRRVVGEHLGRRQQEQRHQHDHDRDRAGGDRRDERRARSARAVDGDDDQSPVEPVGERAGVQAEQQRRQPLQQRGQRDQEGVVASATRPATARPRARSRRPGCSSTTTRAASGTRRRAGRRDGVDESGHRRRRLSRTAARAELPRGRPMPGSLSWATRRGSSARGCPNRCSPGGSANVD